MNFLFHLIGVHGDGAIARVKEWSFYPGAAVPVWLLVLLGVVGLATATGFCSRPCVWLGSAWRCSCCSSSN